VISATNRRPAGPFRHRLHFEVQGRDAPGTGGATRASSEPSLDGVSRRQLIERAGLVGFGALLAQLPAALGAKGLIAEARAATVDVIADTLSAALAFILPGNDDYSKAQGASASSPGAVGGGTLQPFIYALDHFVPVGALNTTVTLPASGAVATLLNSYALQVNPAAANGLFLSPFARLSFKEKAMVFKLFESDQVLAAAVPELKFVAGILPGFMAFMISSEVGVLDSNRNLVGKPVSWTLTGYSGPSDGHNEFKGYYQGRRSVTGEGQRQRRHRKKTH
jgi:hypothetical protein